MKKLFLIFVSLILYQASLFAQLEFWKDNQQLQKSFELPTQALNVNIDSLMLDSIINAYRYSQSIPGIAILIIKDSEVIWNKNYGYRNLELQLPVEDSTLFLIGSISKTIVITAIMQLWENGLIELDNSINDYLPSGFTVVNPYFPNDTITVKMLMTHTSSLQDNWNIMDYLWSCGDYPVTYDSFLVNYFTPGGAYYSLNNFYAYRPGQNWNYSNTGSCLLALMVEHLSGKSFEEYTRDSIFIPLSMNATSWFLHGFDTSKIATPYMYQPPAPMCQTGMAYWPIGQLRTNKLELSNFLSAYINGGIFNNNPILRSSTIKMMLANQSGFMHLFGGIQGLIWYTDPTIYNTVWGHSGGWFGATAYMFFIPSEKWGIFFFINCGNPKDYPSYKPIPHLAYFAHLYGNIYSLNPSIDKSYAKVNVDSILFRTTFSNIYNHQFTPHLIYTNLDSTQIDSLTVFDDGMHGESYSDDGIYGGFIPPLNSEDFYSFGISTIDLQTQKYFTTIDHGRFTTAGPIKLDSIRFLKGITNYYNLRPFVRNEGTSLTISNAKIQLRCTDPWVSGMAGAITLPSIAPGASLGASSWIAVNYIDSIFPGYFNLKAEMSVDGWTYWIDSMRINVITKVEDEVGMPSAFKLEQNYPCPFNSSTKISWKTPVSCWQSIKVFDVLGNELATLVDEYKPAGNYKIEFDANDLSSGIYFYQLKAGEFLQTLKMILIK